MRAAPRYRSRVSPAARPGPDGSAAAAPRCPDQRCPDQYRRAQREREYGSLADDRGFLLAASPLTRIDAIRAPLFIIHAANDPRVPLSEAEQLHAALTARGQECELVVYGDEGHGLVKRVNRLDAFPKAFAFLARHLAA